MSYPRSGLRGWGALLALSVVLGGCSIGAQPHTIDSSAHTPPAVGQPQAQLGPPATPAPPWKGEISSVSAQLEKNSTIQKKALGDVERRVSLLEKELNELRGDLDLARRENQKLQSRLSTEPVPVAVPIVEVNPPARPIVVAPAPAPEPIIVAPPPAPAVLTNQRPPASSREAYEAAFAKLRSGKYQESLDDFNQFLRWFPKDTLADNAQYWIGELHYVQKQYPESLQAFNNVLVQWPASTKVPACLLKIGFAFYELGDMQNARASLTRLVNDYPTSNAVSLANQRLQMIEERVGRP
ncbi:MAG: tol-pal system protein YbgF [Magnetococcales bacterium]|nr:tol-pal system protein YbgF [Magnetococcales bacterium]